jgi:hypothetical protein
MLARNGERPATEWTVNGARKFSGIGNAETSKPTYDKSQAWGRPNTLPAGKSTARHLPRSLRGEESDDYHHAIAVLNDRWRVIACKNRIQWILQKRRGEQSRWRSRYFCRTREGLIACAHEYAAPIGGDGLVILLRLPERIGGES